MSQRFTLEQQADHVEAGMHGIRDALARHRGSSDDPQVRLKRIRADAYADAVKTLRFLARNAEALKAFIAAQQEAA